MGEAQYLPSQKCKLQYFPRHSHTAWSEYVRRLLLACNCIGAVTLHCSLLSCAADVLTDRPKLLWQPLADNLRGLGCVVAVCYNLRGLGCVVAVWYNLRGLGCVVAVWYNLRGLGCVVAVCYNLRGLGCVVAVCYNLLHHYILGGSCHCKCVVCICLLRCCHPAPCSVLCDCCSCWSDVDKRECVCQSLPLSLSPQ